MPSAGTRKPPSAAQRLRHALLRLPKPVTLTDLHSALERFDAAMADAYEVPGAGFVFLFTDGSYIQIKLDPARGIGFRIGSWDEQHPAPHATIH